MVDNGQKQDKTSKAAGAGKDGTTKEVATKEAANTSKEDSGIIAVGTEALALVRTRLDLWFNDEDPASEDQDAEILLALDGAPRGYWKPQPGESLFGYYTGTHVLDMPKFGKRGSKKPEDRELKGFLVFEIANPPHAKEGEDIGVRAKMAGVKETCILGPGETIYVGVASKLQSLTIMSAHPRQPMMGLQFVKDEELANQNKLKLFNTRVLGASRPKGEGQLFAFADEGIRAAKEIYKLPDVDTVAEAVRRKFMEYEIKRGRIQDPQLALPNGERDITPKALPDGKTIDVAPGSA